MSSHPYTREYFEEGTTGYCMYMDFPVHYRTLEIILKRKPKSVLDVGGARGYIVKQLEDGGIRAVCMDISEHCWHTRATDSFVLHDATKAPWPFRDKEFDLCISISTLEHIPEDKINVVLNEMARVSKRGLQGIGFVPESARVVEVSGQLHIVPLAEDTDKTHCLIKPREWWDERFKHVVPDWPVEILDKEALEIGDLKVFDREVLKPILIDGKLLTPIPVPRPDGLVKLNIGSFRDMFHYGWVNIDILDLSNFAKLYGYQFKQVDVTKGLPYESSSVDLIIASHLIEHLTREQGLAFLKECRRVLKPDGLIRLATPDTAMLVKKYLKGEVREYRHVNIGVAQAKDDTEAFHQLLMAGHRTLYDAESLMLQLWRAGFIDTRQMPFNHSQSEVIEKQTFDLHPTLSLYVEGRGKNRQYWITDQCKPSERILDIGSSWGHIFRGSKITHIDIDRYDIPNFIQMDAHDLKFPDKSFDVAVLGELLEHVRDPIQVLREAKRVARKLIITTPNEAGWIKLHLPNWRPPTDITKRRQKAIQNSKGKIVEFYEEDNLDHCFHQRHYNEAMLKEHLKQAGIEDYKLEILNYGGWSFFTVVAEGIQPYRQYLEGKIEEGRQEN